MANWTSYSGGKETYPKFLYHYTNLLGLEGILQKKKLVFWGTRYDSMNDPRDCEFAQRVCLAQVCKDFDIPNVENTNFLRLFPYVVSFTELGDNLNMWRWYNSYICLKLDWELIRQDCIKQQRDFFDDLKNQKEKDLIHFGKCEYTDDSIENISGAISNLNRYVRIEDNDPFVDIQKLCAFIKHNSFEGEKEWRLVKFDSEDIVTKLNLLMANQDLPTDLEKPQRIKVKPLRIDSEDLILYKEFELSSEVLKGIIIRQPDEIKFEKIKKHLNLILKDREIGLPIEEIIRTDTYFNK